MPKIIRSTGVNIERAHPLVVPMKGRMEEGLIVSCPLPEAEQAKPDAVVAQASAEAVVEEILSRARNDADEMLMNARAETMRVLQEAVREGHEQGFAEVQRQWASLKAAMGDEMDKAVESLQNERRQILKDLEQDVLNLVFDIAEKVLVMEMDRSEEWVAAMVKEALRQMENDDTAVIRVAADARTRVTESCERLLAAAGKPISKLAVVADNTMPPGGCVIETERGYVNNGVEEKFDKLKSVLKQNA